LPLDLSASIAKLARADEHFKVLQREVSGLFQEGSPNAATFSEINQANGWCSLFIPPLDKTRQEALGVIVGDFVHNLRCALDYIVSTLAGANLTQRHQFPIADDRNWYLKNVGTHACAVANGLLGGIAHGLQEFWDLQPFQRGPDTEFDPLFSLNRFSNADKHHLILSGGTAPAGPGRVNLLANGKPIAIDGGVDLGKWRPNENFEISRIRWATPYPTQYHLKGEITVEVFFLTPAFGKYPRWQMLSLNALLGLHEHVSKIVDTFKAL
jgi:hypothetical protein